MKYLLAILLSLLIILISFPLRSEELAVSLSKGNAAPYSGILITKEQATDYLETKSNFERCLNQVDQCNGPQNESNMLEAILFFGGGMIAGITVGLILN